MTRSELADTLAALAIEASNSSDRDVLVSSVVLSALAGAIVAPVDHRVLNALARLAGTLCEHELGLHHPRPR